MADPKLVKLIGVKAASGNAGETVILRNLTRGGKLTGLLSSNKDIVFNAAPSAQWQTDDVVQAEMRGRVGGAARAVLSKDAQINITLSVTADTTTPGVTL